MADCPKLIPDDSGAITHTFIQLLTAENDINASNRAMLDSLKNHLPQAKQVVFIDVLVTTKRYADFRMKLLLADNTKGNNLIAAGKELATDYDATLSMILNGSADMTGKPFDQEIWEASRNSRWNQLSQSWRFSEKISTPSESEKLISKPLGNSLAKSNKSTDIATLTKRLNWIDDRLRVMYFKEVKKSNEKQIRTMDFIPGSVRLTFRDDNICVQKIPLDGKYGGYLQDELFILSDENSVRVEKRHIPLSILSEGQEESDMQLIANHINDESVGVPGVFDIAGGNMLVSKDFLLIGDNAFYLRYTCEWNPTSKDNYAKINYPTKSAGITPRDYLTKRLAERFLGSDDPKDVKWVGFNELKEVFSPSFSEIDTQIGNFQYQPVKH